ncbi:group II intron reverse transcriptase [Candidatus Williamhamiltonella defendens]|uniref:group II intron reverse transcriptase n=1 Tax=Candidatus Williamhamiltonella defendens TaxID=138072 RepID=UPI002A4E10EB|nr:group II intron maturase-specific domain-containing protein [Candidatus Hamiltonella defensa]
MKPSKESIKRYRQQMRMTWKRIIGMPTKEGIMQLNEKIIGWCNYYRIGASKQTFSAIDQWMWIRQCRYLYRRHPNKHWWWRRKHYLGKIPGREDYSVFMDKSNGGFLWKHAWTKIQRHWLVTKNASPDNPELRDYWRHRQARKQPFIYGVKVNLYKRQKGYCPLCDQELDNGEQLHVHNIQPKAEGGDNKLANLRLLHANCHRQLHSKKGKMLKSVSCVSRMRGNSHVRFLREWALSACLPNQSKPEKLMAFRLLRYAVAAMQRHLEQGNDTLPVVVPVILPWRNESLPVQSGLVRLF